MAYDDEDLDYGESDDDDLGGDTEVTCPYCGESVPISIDRAGGEVQEYVEDCSICCRPWKVHVTLTRGGGADVHLEEEGN